MAKVGKDGILTTSKDKILSMWKEHFQELFSQGEPTNKEETPH